MMWPIWYARKSDTHFRKCNVKRVVTSIISVHKWHISLHNTLDCQLDLTMSVVCLVNIQFFSSVDVEFLANELENLYKIVHLVNFNTSIQALMLLYQVMDTRYEHKEENMHVHFYRLKAINWMHLDFSHQKPTLVPLMAHDCCCCMVHHPCQQLWSCQDGQLT